MPSMIIRLSFFKLPAKVTMIETNNNPNDIFNPSPRDEAKNIIAPSDINIKMCLFFPLFTSPTIRVINKKTNNKTETTNPVSEPDILASFLWLFKNFLLFFNHCHSEPRIKRAG